MLSHSSGEYIPVIYSTISLCNNDWVLYMMTSSNENISALLVICAGIPRWIPHTQASEAEL